jgi:hypothetical protein
MADPTFQIPKDVIEPIIKAQVAAAVVAALGDKGAIIENAVAAVLNSKVDSDGKPDKYGYGGSVSWVQWVMNDCVKTATREAITEAMEKQRGRVKAAITKELTNSKSPLVRKLVDALAGSLDSDSLKYRISVGVEQK